MKQLVNKKQPKAGNWLTNWLTAGHQLVNTYGVNVNQFRVKLRDLSIETLRSGERDNRRLTIVNLFYRPWAACGSHGLRIERCGRNGKPSAVGGAAPPNTPARTAATTAAFSLSGFMSIRRFASDALFNHHHYRRQRGGAAGGIGRRKAGGKHRQRGA